MYITKNSCIVVGNVTVSRLPYISLPIVPSVQPLFNGFPVSGTLLIRACLAREVPLKPLSSLKNCPHGNTAPTKTP